MVFCGACRCVLQECTPSIRERVCWNSCTLRPNLACPDRGTIRRHSSAGCRCSFGQDEAARGEIRLETTRSVLIRTTRHVHEASIFIQSVPEGARFVECIDASGDTKDAKYQAGFVVKCMRKSGGVQVYFVLWFDGACKPAFPLIEKEVPHVSCVVDAAHSMDLVGKNICSTKPYVAPPGRRRMKVGGGPGVRSLRGEASTQCF